LEAEIIVVDNASEDDTSAVVKQWEISSAFPVRLLREPRKGLARARNCGIRQAQGDLMAFTDDDCRLSEDYVKDLLRHHAADSRLLIRGGRIELGDPTDMPLTIKTNTVPMRWDRTTDSARYELIAGKSISGCNMTMQRKVIDKLGLFDERLGAGTTIPGGEDTDYYLRAYLVGIPVEYVPDMVVFHWHGRKSPSDAKKLMKNYIIANGALHAKYVVKAPYLCHELYWDLKKSIKDLTTGQNTFLPEWNVSYCDKVLYCVMGMMKFLYVSLTARAVS
jgi:GT2 family glycosyltransferase